MRENKGKLLFKVLKRKYHWQWIWCCWFKKCVSLQILFSCSVFSFAGYLIYMFVFIIKFSTSTLDFYHLLLLRDALILLCEETHTCHGFVISRDYIWWSDFEPTGRDRCIHYQGDYAFNATRLTDHIINPYHGCRWLLTGTREHAREGDKTQAALRSAETTSTAAAVKASAWADVAMATRVAGNPAQLTVTTIQHQPSQCQTKLQRRTHSESQPRVQSQSWPPSQFYILRNLE